MDLLNQYADDSSEEQLTTLPSLPKSASKRAKAATESVVTVDVAPDVVAYERAPHFANPYSVALNANIKADELWVPVAGPKHPLHRDALVPGEKNTLTGFVESHHMNNYQFSEQYDSFRNNGYAEDPDKRGTVLAKQARGQKERRKKRVKRNRGDPEGEFWGSWAPPDEEDEEGFSDDEAVDMDAAVTEEQAQAIEERLAAQQAEAIAKQKKLAAVVEQTIAAEERTEFHGKSLTDYQGRTYMWPPSDVKPTEHDCYIPKKHIHTFKGHTKEVNCVRYFPVYGHLLLSCSADNTIKIWDANNHRRCLRTMYGHKKAVRDLCWNQDGSKFLSTGYDDMIRLWDTETGRCLGRFSNGPMAYQARLKPDDDNSFIAGCQDKKIYQWDVRSNSVVQEYNEHLSAINSVTFIDNNRRFVSTSDDKKIFVWEYGIPVVIKHVSDPKMNAVPTTAVHPSGKFMACQNLNNTITVYESTERFRLKASKVFRGHTCAGYAVQLAFSPCGRFLCSGSGNGQAHFWDWRSTRMYRTLKCHEAVCISIDWHPIEPSHVVTGGWDGLIQLFD